MIGKSPNSHFYKKVRVLNRTSLPMTISITNKCARRIVMLYSNASISLVLKHRLFSLPTTLILPPVLFNRPSLFFLISH
jgi:hypothetical protein